MLNDTTIPIQWLLCYEAIMGLQAKGKKLSGAQVGSYNVLKIMSLNISLTILRCQVLCCVRTCLISNKLSFFKLRSHIGVLEDSESLVVSIRQNSPDCRDHSRYRA